MLIIQNGLGEIKETVFRSVFFDSKGEAIVVEKRRVNGSFTEYMELNQFPFDTQVISDGQALRWIARLTVSTVRLVMGT